LQLLFTIRDTGIGIPAEQIDQLFQPFTQADESTTRRFGGTGLGLSICKQLVALMGGEIYCESTPGLGSVFSFTAWFGIGQADSIIPTHAASTTATAYDFSAYHVLLVEDNEVNQQLAIELLKDTGVGVSVASNGSEAVLLVTEGDREYDLVLMDIQMPVMDGYEATRLIRSDSRFARLPIIAMTAHAMQEEQQKILQSGMAAHIPKPIDIRTLLRVMRLFLGEPSAEMLLPNVPAESDGAVADIPVIAGLDVADALDRLDGNGKLYHWLLRSFVENKAEVLKIIDEALQSGDTDLAVRTAHTVKSSAGTIGAVSLELQAQILESAIERGESPETVSAALGSCAVEIERVRAELAKYLPPVAQTADGTLPVAVDEVLVVPALQRLLGYIEGNDCAVERYFDNHHHELHSLPDLDTERLKKHLQNFDFSAAREALLALAEKHGLKLKVRTQ
jgi:CheY-like chemotaxis protein